MKKSNKFLLLFTGLGVACILLFLVCIVVSKNQGSSYEILGINALLLEAVLFIIGMKVNGCCQRDDIMLSVSTYNRLYMVVQYFSRHLDFFEYN